MGFIVTVAAAVAITVAAFHMLAFCQMKFSHKAEIPTSDEAQKITIKNVFCFGHTTTLQNAKKNPKQQQNLVSK